MVNRSAADRGYLSHTQAAALAGAVERQGEIMKFLTYTGHRASCALVY